MLTLKARVGGGAEISQTAAEAIELAKKLDCYIDFKFNGFDLWAGPKSTVESLVSQYWQSMRGDKAEGAN